MSVPIRMASRGVFGVAEDPQTSAELAGLAKLALQGPVSCLLEKYKLATVYAKVDLMPTAKSENL